MFVEQVYHDLLWGKFSNHHFGMYTHKDPYGCVWKMQSVRVHDQSVVLSVGSDGTLRWQFPSIQTVHKNSYAGLQAYAVEGVQHDVEAGVDEVRVSTKCASTAPEYRPATKKSVAKETSKETQDQAQAQPSQDSAPQHRVGEYKGCALHALAAIPLASSSSSSSSKKGKDKGKSLTGTQVLVAYGGATGIVRVHTIDLVSQFCENFLFK